MADLKMSNFRVSDHSGDLKIEAWGRDCLEALAHASSGLVDQIVSLGKIDEVEERSISVTGEDDTEQYIAFLNELLFLVYTKKWLPHRVRTLQRCSRTGCRELEAVLVGEPLDSARHEIKYDIKAVTYHDFAIHTDKDSTHIQFVCDL